MAATGAQGSAGSPTAKSASRAATAIHARGRVRGIASGTSHHTCIVTPQAALGRKREAYYKGSANRSNLARRPRPPAVLIVTPTPELPNLPAVAPALGEGCVRFGVPSAVPGQATSSGLRAAFGLPAARAGGR